MTVFTCNDDLESMLTCIYDAWYSRLGHSNVRLATEPIEQLNMFDTYIHVEPNTDKAMAVADAINRRISPAFYSEVAFCLGAYEKDALDTVYRVLILGFKLGVGVLDAYGYDEVARFKAIRIRYGREASSFLEFVRFNLVDGVYVAHFEPKSRVLLPVAEHFSDRMPSEHWMLIDDVHKEAAVHPCNEQYYVRILSEEEFARLKATEDYDDGFTALWKIYFTEIAIKERENPKCQLTHFAKWKRKHVTEFA
ncbi:MAG: TIGR03915 family putative DNA repair protein [Lachnospiraceae bacterium]|nr:TIGR03915 family putative DNA repair protein [Lachnospiraceae bacterium]